MKIIKSVLINKPAQEVWRVLAEDFENAQDWMAAVPVSYAKQDGFKGPNSSIAGRICELSTKPNGPIADETITVYDTDSKILGIKVVPKNGKIPIEENNATYSVKSIADDKSEVIMQSSLQLKTVGKVFYPALKLGISKSFQEQLEELKFYVETGIAHPRKKK